MSLYAIQKFLFEFNRTPALQEAYRVDRAAAVARYELTEEEAAALVDADVGLLYHFGVNGQLLMHFAAWHQIEWSEYLRLMRDGVERHGPVREGIYAMTGYAGVDAPER